MKKALSAFFAVCVIGTMLFALAGQALGVPSSRSTLFVNDVNMFEDPGTPDDSIYFDEETNTLYLTDATIDEGTFCNNSEVYGFAGILASNFDLTIVLEGENTIRVQDSEGVLLTDSAGIAFTSTPSLTPNEEILPAELDDPHTLTIKSASPGAYLDITAIYNGLFSDGSITIDGATVYIDSSDAVFAFYDIDIKNDAYVDATGGESFISYNNALLLALGVITVDGSTLVGHASNDSNERDYYAGLVSSPSWLSRFSTFEAESQGKALFAAELDSAKAPGFPGAENGGIIIKNSNVTITADAGYENNAIYSEGNISIDKSTVSCLATSDDFTCGIGANVFPIDDEYVTYDLTVTDSTLIIKGSQGTFISGDIEIENSKVTSNGSCGTGLYAAGDIYVNGLSTLEGSSLDSFNLGMRAEAISQPLATPGIAALGTININLSKGGLISGTGSTGLWRPGLLTLFSIDSIGIFALETDLSSLDPAEVLPGFDYSFAPGIVAGEDIIVAKTNEVTFPAKGKIGTLSVTEPEPMTNTLVLQDDGSMAQEALIAAVSPLPLTGDASVMWLVALLVAAALGAAGAVARKVYVRTHK